MSEMLQENTANDTSLGIKKKKPVPAGFIPWKKGQSGNPAGRPKGSISIKDQIRWYLDNNPNEVQKIVHHFVTKNRELMWQMLEGSPKSTSEVKSESVELKVTGADLLLAQQLRERRLREREPGSSASSDGDGAQSLGREVPN